MAYYDIELIYKRQNTQFSHHIYQDTDIDSTSIPYERRLIVAANGYPITSAGLLYSADLHNADESYNYYNDNNFSTHPIMYTTISRSDLETIGASLTITNSNYPSYNYFVDWDGLYQAPRTKTWVDSITGNTYTTTFYQILHDSGSQATQYDLHFTFDSTTNVINVNQNLTNCTSDYTSATANKGTTYTVTLDADAGYLFKAASDISATYGTVNASADSYSATIVFTATTQDITITATASQIAYLQTTLTDCTCNYPNNKLLYVGDTYQAVITANTGYYFTSTGDISATYGTVSLSQDGAIAYVDFVATSSNNAISATATPVPATINVTQNLTYCTSDYTSATAIEGNSYTITLTPTTDYYFASSANVTATYGTVTIANDGSYATIQFTATQNNITINATASAKPTISVTQNLSNCTSDYTSGTAIVGNSYVITINANTDYYFVAANSVTATYGTITISPDNTYATISFTATSSNLIIAANAQGNPINVTQNLTNCTSDYTANIGIPGDNFTIQFTPTPLDVTDVTMKIRSVTSNYGTITIASDYSTAFITGTFTTTDLTITVNATHGYILSTGVLQNANVSPAIGSIIWEDNNSDIIITGVDSYIRFYDNDGVHMQSYLQHLTAASIALRWNFTVSSDNTYATISDLQIPYRVSAYNTIYINAYGYDTAYTGRLLSDIRAYTLYCYDGLYDSANEMSTITTIMRSSTHQPGVIQFFISHIKPIVSAYTRAITVMGQTINATAYIPYILKYNIEVNCGDVTIARKYNNAIDYNAKIQIYLPFIGTQTLDTTRVMGKTIHLVYRADFITGQCIAVLYINDIIVEQYKGQFIERFQTRDRDSTLGSLDYDVSVLYDLTPCIIIEDVDNITEFTHETYAYGRIGTFSGYNRFDNIKLICNCANVIYEDIISQLKEGVIINNVS